MRIICTWRRLYHIKSADVLVQTYFCTLREKLPMRSTKESNQLINLAVTIAKRKYSKNFLRTLRLRLSILTNVPLLNIVYELLKLVRATRRSSPRIYVTSCTLKTVSMKDYNYQDRPSLFHTRQALILQQLHEKTVQAWIKILYPTGIWKSAMKGDEHVQCKPGRILRFSEL